MNIPGRSWRIRVGADETTAAWDPASNGAAGPLFICAHGAGGHMADRPTTAVAGALRERGVGVVRFNFFYKARGSSRPDPMPRLLACYAAVVQQIRDDLRPDVLVLGGRSMGGRVASMLVSQGTSCQGLLLLAYPLHPPGQPEKLRSAHLGAIHPPVLCVNGTRDPFCDPALMEMVLRDLRPHWRMQWIEGADHSFHVPKQSGRSDGEVLTTIADDAVAWMAGL